MTNLGRTSRLRLAVGVVATVLGALGLIASAPAMAVGAPVEPATDGLSTHWDGPAIAFDWQGKAQTIATGTFVGERLVSPGDEVYRTVLVRNEGPSDAKLLVAISNPSIQGVDGPILADILTLTWAVDGTPGEANFAEMVAKNTLDLGSAPVGRCEEVPVTVGYKIPIEETRGAGSSGATVTFDVRLTMQGDADPTQDDSWGCNPDDGGGDGGGGSGG
ncbi:MAG: hypothetical protein LBH48_06795, partial [Bifidobacteriaceae bacterium]|nr:hypothetical protein [Bifidobacteriaceae bacterium]